MQRVPLLLLFVLFTNFLFSQNEKHNEIFKAFQDNYNTGNYETIFIGFSSEMKTALPVESTKQFLSGLKFQAGNIKDGTFLKFENGSFAAYKTEFEKGVFTVNISLDQFNLINGLSIKPYVVQSTSIVINNLFAFPNDIAAAIYSQVKDFPNKTQLSIAVLKDNTVKYYGIIKENDTINSIEIQNKIFEIGSITKVFTASVLASLSVDHKLELSDYINNYYPFRFNSNTKISFLDLANHTSGLPRLPENLDLSSIQI